MFDEVYMAAKFFFLNRIFLHIKIDIDFRAAWKLEEANAVRTAAKSRETNNSHTSFCFLLGVTPVPNVCFVGEL